MLPDNSILHPLRRDRGEDSGEELLREECGIESGDTKPLETEFSELLAIFTTMINRPKDKERS